MYTVFQKWCQVIFCSWSVKHELISMKICRNVPGYILNENEHKVPTSFEVCAYTTLGNSKCLIELSTQQLTAQLND